MVNTAILSNNGNVERQTFASFDLACAGLLDILRGKMHEEQNVLAVIEEEDSKYHFAFIEDNDIVTMSPKDFFSKYIAFGKSEFKKFDSSSLEFESLKELLFSDEWPQAVFSSQIADENSEDDKKERAEGIADILLPSLDGKKFLDFGCGEGHVADYCSKLAELSVGYDIEKNSKSKFDWEKVDQSFILTTNFDLVRSKGPYDIILLYDVLDHVKKESMREVLEKAKSVLAEDGKMYLRCHPWSGRHGGHVYKKINKAFVHLVFTEKELRDIGVEVEANQKVIFPLATYSKAIGEAGLTTVEEQEIDFQEVEPFFSKNDMVKKRILDVFEIKQWGKDEKPAFQMSQCFVDYILAKSI
jgi:cyclopropane fatty-acyl-phospholipid synthase-like methyltransferase